jgi:hypothetical protein
LAKELRSNLLEDTLATIDPKRVFLIPSGGGTPAAASDGDPAGTVDCTCPGISAAGAIVLLGAAGESIAGWSLGYVQLKFIATDYARYRGNRDADGSLVFTKSNLILCRDTDETSPEIWYDPIAGGITPSSFFLLGFAIPMPRGTTVLPAGTRIPPSGEFPLASGFLDAPERHFDAVIFNTASGQNNFIHHLDVGLAFCTLLTARDPGGSIHFLKHFYWNVRWEALFQRDAMNIPQITRIVHFQLNIQHTVHSGTSSDPRFRGREADMTLPISNVVSGHPPRIRTARNWSLM